MTTASILTDYTDALRSEPERWLGLVVLYSVGDTTIPHSTLEGVLNDAGLGDYVPRPPSDADVFRRTCTAAQRKRQPTADANRYANVLVRDVANDDDEIVKRMVVETVDATGRRLDYSPAYDLVFDKRYGQVDVRRLGFEESAIADDVAMEIAREYGRLRATVDGACIRTVIGRILDACKATSLRQGGGSYFVGRDDAHIVAGLEQFAAAIPPKDIDCPAPVLLHSIPLPNDPKQRRQLHFAYEEEAKVEIERLILEIRTALTSGKKISGPAIATFARKYNHQTEKLERYGELLDSQLSSVRGSLALLDIQMAALTGVKKVA